MSSAPWVHAAYLSTEPVTRMLVATTGRIKGSAQSVKGSAQNTLSVPEAEVSSCGELGSAGVGTRARPHVHASTPLIDGCVTQCATMPVSCS